MAKHTATPESILSTLSPEAASVLENHYRQQIASELAAGIVGSAKPVKRASKAAKKAGPVRQKTSDGRSASQFIRDCDAANPDISAKDVCAKAAEAGLNVNAPLVYNVRQLARKKAAANQDEKAQAKAKDETYQKRLKALEKARAKRAENRAKAEKEANAKTAKSSKKSK